MSLFTNIAPAPADPILGITDTFKADPNPKKVNLGVGIYQDGTGKLPLLECVAAAEARIAAAPTPRPYLPINGAGDYTALTRELVFGAEHPAVTQGRIVTIQTLAGTGALKVGGDFVHTTNPDARLLVSDPTWENHQAVFGGCGFEIGRYRYYDAAAHGVDFTGLLADIKAAEPGTVVLLHACCHNPSGYDLTQSQWDQIIEVCQAGQLVPFVDMAYQGFAESPDADAYGPRALANTELPFLVASSFSKTLGLYGERIGALSIGCEDADQAARVLSRVKLAVRANYSNPPTHGARIVTTVLSDPDLRTLWTSELTGMRERIKTMRQALVSALHTELAHAGISHNFDYITAQRGMFSYSGLNPAQMQALRAEHSVYGVDNGRLCVAALNENNVEYVAASIAAVLAG